MDILAEGGGVDSEGHSVVRVTPATSVEGPDTGPSTARDEVIQRDAKQTHVHRYVVIVIMLMTAFSFSPTEDHFYQRVFCFFGVFFATTVHPIECSRFGAVFN